MTRNQSETITTATKLKPDVADVCSCTSCDSLGCFAYRQAKYFNHSKTSVVYANKTANLDDESETSVFIATGNITPPENHVIDVIKTDTETDTTMYESRYSDLENKTENISKSTWRIDKPNSIMERIEAIMKEDKEHDAGAKLSAQVMNLSYKDFKQSISYNRSDTSYKTDKISKYDIFQRIKDVYRACSCKVCECIAGISTRNELCKCKPCECNDCMSYLGKLKQTNPVRTLQKDCVCKQFNNNALSGIAKTLNDVERCKCEPCRCIECTERLMKYCNCESCQCIECKSMLVRRPTPFIVAPVVEDYQQNTCQCSPCECIECGRRCGLSSNLRHEMSTATNRQKHAQCRCEICQNEACEPDGVGSCKCERRHRVISKPVERDAHEYDIRRLLVNNSCRNKHTRHDTIAMFAAVSNNYPKLNKCNERQCTCDECECIVRCYNEDAVNSIKSSKLFTPAWLQLNKKSSLNTRDMCNYQPCECEVCKYRGNQSDRHSKRLCEVCECVNCRQRRTTPVKQVPRDKYKYRPCECANCDKIIAKRNRQPAHETCIICKLCMRNESPNSEVTYSTKSVSTSPNTSLSCRDSKSNINSQPESLSIYRACPTIDYPQQSSPPITMKQSYGSIRQASLTDHNLKPKRAKCPKTCNTLNCDAYTQYRKQNKGLYKSNSMGSKASGSYVSDSSSIKSNSKTSSYFKFTGSGTPVSGHKDKSCESSCNSSGYDYPDYLVQFPKSTVETCLKDVMKLNLDKNIKLDKIKITPNTQVRKRYIESASYENSSSGKQRLSQGYEEHNKYRQVLKPVDIKRSSHRRLRRRGSEHKYVDDKKRGNPKKNCSYNRKYETNKLPCTRCAPNTPCRDATKDRIFTYVTKNKNTQTGENGATRITKSTSSIIIKRHERNNNRDKKDFQMMKNLKEFQISRNVYDYNVINQKIGNVIPNEQFEWKYSSTYFSKSKDAYKIDEDYKSVHKTLQDAKLFSVDLLKLLAKYEKENREFESISDKLKLSHKLMLNSSLMKRRGTFDEKKPSIQSDHKSHYSNENELREIHLEAPSTEEKTSLQVFPKTMIKDKSDEGRIIFQKSRNPSISNNSNGNRFILVIMPRENSKNSKENELIKSIQDKIRANEINVTSMKEKVTHNQECSTNKPVIPKTSKGRAKKRTCKNYSKLMKRTVIVSKKITVNNTDHSKPAVICATTDDCSTSAIQSAVTDGTVTTASINTTVAGQSITISEGTDMKIVELRRVMHKLDAVFGTTEEISVSTSVQELGQKRKENEGSTTVQTQDLESRKPWPILKKNYNLVDKASAKGKGVCIFPSLELEVKNAVQSISLQTSDKPERSTHSAATQSQRDHAKPTIAYEKTPPTHHLEKDESDFRKDTSNIRRKSKLDLEQKDPPKAISLQTSLEKMESNNKEIICDHFMYSKTEDIERQIKELLNLTLLQTISRKLMHSDNPTSIMDVEPRLPRIESSKSSCDALKASFLGVRRVSDHTVLVKWNLPREVTDVQGYELLVDGRAVQKVLSPSRCMAVVTCLPRCERVLLTVRTLTALVARGGHYPAASIVYQPRHK